MHFFFILLTVNIWCVMNATDVMAQDIINKRITIQFKDNSLRTALNQLANKAGCQFIFNSDLFSDHSKVSYKAINQPLQVILDVLLRGYPVIYNQSGKYIYIKRKSDSAPKPNKAVSLKGQVIDAQTQAPMLGVSIAVKGTTLGTTTDGEGKYSLTIDAADPVVVFSFIGYGRQEHPIGNMNVLNVSLTANMENLNQVVVIGYGTQTRKDLTTAIGSVKGTELKDQPVLNYEQALVGKLAGVQVLQTSGEPGRSLSFRIRGTTSITAGNAPLFVVDGVPLERQGQASESLNPNDIASVEVLKDASAAAIYGSRGANGVVIITTKQGSAKGLKVGYNQLTGIQLVSKKISMLDAYGYASLAKDGHDNAWIDFAAGNSAATPDSDRGTVEAAGWYWNQTPPDLYPYLENQQGLTNTDWQDEIFRQAAFSNHSLNFTGGNDQIKYYVAGNYTSQQGVVINSNYKRYSARFNLDVTQNRLKLGMNLAPSYSIADRINGDGPYLDQGVVASALQMSPTWAVTNPDGTYNFEGNGKWRIGKDYQHNAVLNPVALANLISNKNHYSSLLGRFFVNYEIVQGLQYELSLGGTINNDRTAFYRPSTLPNLGEAFYLTASNPTAQSSTTTSTNWVLEQTATYNTSMGGHHFSALGGFTAQRNWQSANSLTATNFPNDLVQTLNAGQVTVGSSTEGSWSLLSLLARVKYDYKGKYLLSAALRRDGSSRFGPETKWGNFPSVSAGWRISEEPFMQNVKAFSNLKLRTSYGITGNFQISNYEAIGRLQYDNYILGSPQGQLTSGVMHRNISNSGLGWEKTAMTDIGIEAGLFGELLTLELDWYDRNTSNLLLNVPVPLTTGFGVARRNIGKVNNRGFEMTLSTQQSKGAINWSTSINLAANRNKVRALGPGNAPIIQTNGTTNTFFITQVGSPIGSYYLLKETGVYRNQADLDGNPHFAGAQPGDFKFSDIDGDGKLDVNNDRTIVGDYFPSYTYGLNASIGANGFELGITMQGVQGVEIVNLMRRYINSMEGTFNNTTDALDRWRSQTDHGDGQTNRANRKAKGNNGRSSSWHVENGSYLRLQNITLGYTVPKKLTNRIRIGSARIYVSGQNLLTFTKYSGYNPEVNLYDSDALTPGVDYGSYPLAKTIAGGINLTF